MSPDGTRLALNRSTEEGTTSVGVDLWLIDPARSLASRLTFDPGVAASPVWSPEGQRILYASNRAGRYELYLRTADGGGEPEFVARASGLIIMPTDWSPDGRCVVYEVDNARTSIDVWLARRSGRAAAGRSPPSRRRRRGAALVARGAKEHDGDPPPCLHPIQGRHAEGIMTAAEFTPLKSYVEYAPEEMRRRAIEFREEVRRRRTVRHFSVRQVPREIIEACLEAAGSAPSGANLQPWHFVAVSDPETKRRIRSRAEVEEREFYQRRAPREWLEALAPLGTDASKPFLETAPWLIAVFAASHSLLHDGRRVKNYYVLESVGIATGILICALHHAGLATLTHTPSPMGFLGELLGRPREELAFLLLVAGFPAADALVPHIGKKPLEEIATFV